MIALSSSLRVYLACGVTDMRKGMVGVGDAGAAGPVHRSFRRDSFRLSGAPGGD